MCLIVHLWGSVQKLVEVLEHWWDVIFAVGAVGQAVSRVFNKVKFSMDFIAPEPIEVFGCEQMEKVLSLQQKANCRNNK